MTVEETIAQVAAEDNKHDDIETGGLPFQVESPLGGLQSSIISQLSSLEEQRNSSNHRRQTHVDSNNNISNGAEGIVRAEANIVRNLRIAMVCLIIFAAALCGYMIYKISSKNETDAFKQSFEEAATKFAKAFTDTQSENLNYAYAISIAMSSGLYVDSDYIPSFPNVSLEHLDVLAKGLTKRRLVDDLIWSPILNALEQRSSFESYALSKLANVSGSSFPPCNVCGEGNEILNPSSLISVPGFRQVTCADMNQYLQTGSTSPQQCSFMTTLAKPVCGCQKSVGTKYTNGSSLLPSQNGIFRLQDDGVPVVDKGPPPYAPVWQITPSTDSKQVAMFNLLSEPWRRDAFNDMIKLNIPVYSKTYEPSEDGVYKLNSMPSLGATASIFYPVFKNLDSSEVAGTLVLDFSWIFVFNYIIPPKSDGVVIVLENTLGQMFTYKVLAGLSSFLGEGDLHDDRFASIHVESDYMDFKRILYFSGPNNHNYNATKPLPECLYRVRVYPSHEFENRHRTSKPATYTLIVVLAFGVTTLVFLAYDWIVRRLQSKVLDSAKRSEAIVSSLFPAFVRDRVFGNAKSQTTSTSSFRIFWGRRGVNLDNPLVNHKVRLKTYLSHPLSFDMLGNTDPIADLYPNTTVMFADISGFTAWSSEREPSQVFKLLESLFCEFDKVARELGVFKVETIGDCYVAVTGLPEKMNDHAVVMVEFAVRCRVRMRELVSKLEAILGPGTADLSIRVGLHSGPVTAGVLRGDRARLQLFGDTMNVASRMESTCEPNHIHISKETADLLIEAGKEYLVTQRSELVSIKGKGQMQTYWAGTLSLANVVAEENAVVMSTCGGEVLGRSSARDDSLDGTEADIWGGTSLENSVVIRSTSSQGRERLVDWFSDLLFGLLQKIVVKNNVSGKPQAASKDLFWKPITDSAETQFVEEITEVIEMPNFNERITGDPIAVELGTAARAQLRDYVSHIASLYKGNAFHNFEHACHVAMSASKLLKRIIAPDNVEYKTKSGQKMKSHKTVSKEVHESTFGISSDPLMQFAVVFSALIHDVDHTGVTNKQLVNEDDPLAVKYHGKCVAEQRSIQVAWDALMEEKFVDLRRCIYQTHDDKQRFRQLLVNAVIATDIADKELGMWRKTRWDKVFHQEPSLILDGESIRDRKATIVFEYIIQASDVAHTMQHWHVYQKWNKRLFDERYAAYLAGREPDDPSLSWHKGEIWFFDNYIIPLAKKLEECKVFGVSCDEFLTYALQNRHEWELKGEMIVGEMVAAQNNMTNTES